MNDKKLRKSIHVKEYHIVVSLLRELREKKGLTQKDLAESIGSDQTFVSKIEIGERRIDVIELRLICKALGLGIVDFVRLLEARIRKML
jgi:transcriptional regulator with XRE-family HTH domain